MYPNRLKSWSPSKKSSHCNSDFNSIYERTNERIYRIYFFFPLSPILKSVGHRKCNESLIMDINFDFFPFGLNVTIGISFTEGKLIKKQGEVPSSSSRCDPLFSLSRNISLSNSDIGKKSLDMDSSSFSSSPFLPLPVIITHLRQQKGKNGAS